jgi:hypothetical protein
MATSFGVRAEGIDFAMPNYRAQWQRLQRAHDAHAFRGREVLALGVLGALALHRGFDLDLVLSAKSRRLSVIIF